MSASETILIDTDILISFPQILEIRSNFFKLATTSHVVQDIRSGYNVAIDKKLKKRLLDKIDVCDKEGTFKIYSLDIESSFLSGVQQLTSSETSLIDLAVSLQNNSSVSIASMNENIINAAKSLKIKIYDLDATIDIYARHSGRNKEDIKMNLYYNRKDLVSLRYKILFGVAVLAVLVLGYRNKELIISNLSATGTIILTIIIAVCLFVFREKQRISYGILELGVGLTSIILIFYPSFNLTGIRFDLFFGVKYLGGLYIMIRGLDNIVRGLSKTSTGQVLRYKYKIGL